MKRIISWLLAVTLLLTLAMPVAMAADERKSGAFTYRIKGNGTAAITGYEWGSQWIGEEIYIPRMLDGYTVTEIANSAFSAADERGFTAENDRKIVSSLVIPDTVTVIGEQAFMGCDFTCVSISIPASVQHIGAGAFSDLGREFKQFTINGNNKTYATIDGILYNKVQKELVACPKYGGLESNTIPEGIKSIGAYSCVGGYFSQISLPSTLNNIGKYAFGYAEIDQIGYAFGTIKLPDSLSTMGEGAFYHAENTSYSGWIQVNLSETQLTKIPAFAFAECRGIIEIKFPASLCEIGEEAFAEVDFISDRRDTVSKTVSLASTQVTSIGDRAFYQSSIPHETIELPLTLQSIGSQTFYSARPYNYIKNLTLPASVTEIGDNMCNREKVVLNVEPGSYAAVWASENGYIVQSDATEDTSWLGTDVGNAGDIYVGESMGFGGKMKVQITVANGVIANIDVIEHTEILGGEAFESLIAEALIKQSANLDSVSGATVSSHSFMEALTNALKQMEGK